MLPRRAVFRARSPMKKGPPQFQLERIDVVSLVRLFGVDEDSVYLQHRRRAACGTCTARRCAAGRRAS